MVSRLDRSCPPLDSRRAHRKFQKGFRRRLDLGNDLLLWDVLVASLSDDSLRADSRVDRLSAAVAADSFRRAFSRSVLCQCFSGNQTVRGIGDSFNSLSLGFV